MMTVRIWVESGSAKCGMRAWLPYRYDRKTYFNCCRL